MQHRELRIEHLLEHMQLRLAVDLVARPHSRWTDSIVTWLWSKLARNTLMLEYYLTEQDIYIFQLTREGLNVHLVQGAVPKLERLLSLWRVNLDLAGHAAGVQDRALAFAGLQENSLGQLQRLYDLLLNPLSAALDSSNHLIVIPYATFHYLPLHSLSLGFPSLLHRHHL